MLGSRWPSRSTLLQQASIALERCYAVAGDVEQDFWLAFDLLRSAKDHAEFTVVRESVRDALGRVADEVRVDREKSVLKQAAVQHLYGRLSAKLRAGCGDADLLVRFRVQPGRPGPCIR